MGIRANLLLIIVILVVSSAAWIHFRTFQPISSQVDAPVRGSYHIHTHASHDGSTSPQELRDAAQLANLQFLVVTDHNVSSQFQSDANLTVLDYPELSTAFGHVIGFGLSTPLPSTIRKKHWILDEIESRGGKAIVAHPTRLRNPWQGSWYPVGGVEIHNIADQLQMNLSRTLEFLFTLPFHTELALAHLFKRDSKAISRWDDFSDPQVIGICANDSHGRFNLQTEISLWALEINAPWPSDAKGRKFSAIHSIATGSFHCSSSIIEHGGGFEFFGELKNQERAYSGQTVSQIEIDSLVINAPKLESDQVSIVLIRNGEPIAQTSQSRFRYRKPIAGTYRVEIHVTVPKPIMGSESIPVIYSNKIRVGN